MDYMAKNSNVKVLLEFENQELILNEDFMIYTDKQRL
jgi:hypothetical protein